jgi:phage shock protein PspC (stress-responsive transcriptional regulator)
MNGIYRNSDDTWLAGVCGGLAAHFEIDPSIIRVLMALFCFGGWGIILYLVLWIVLPKKALGPFTGKRFYRDMDNKTIGGVASGIGDYFHWDIRVVRLVFIAPLLLSLFFGVFSWPFFITGFWFWNFMFHGSIVGTFVFAYILLWIVLPPSHRDGPSTVSPQSSTLHDPPPPPVQESRRIATSIGQPIGVIVRVFFFFLAGILIFAFFVALIAALFAGAFLWPLYNYIWTTSWQEYYALGTLLFFIGVPVLGLIIWLLRRAMGVKPRSYFLGLTFVILWLVGLACAICLAVSFANDFRYYEHSLPLNIPIEVQPVDGRLTVIVSEPALNPNHSWLVDNNSFNWDFSDEELKLPFVRIRPSMSPDASFHVAIEKLSAGKNRDDAIRRADEIKYRVSCKDGVLNLGNGLSILQGSKYRFQSIVVAISIPVGKRISFDRSIREKLDSMPTPPMNGERWSRAELKVMAHSEDFAWKTNTDYIMTAEGTLKEAE